MAIYQRERSFQNIINNIDVKIIPIEFIKDITCTLDDGNTVLLKSDDLVDKKHNNIESIIKELDFFEDLVDLRIRVDFGKVEELVKQQTSELLDDKGNFSM